MSAFGGKADVNHCMGECPLLAKSGHWWANENDGSGEPNRTPHETVKWYRKAAEQGHATAQFMWGLVREFLERLR